MSQTQLYQPWLLPWHVPLCVFVVAVDRGPNPRSSNHCRIGRPERVGLLRFMRCHTSIRLRWGVGCFDESVSFHRLEVVSYKLAR